jgi:beta-N-acetylhexosaminidase
MGPLKKSSSRKNLRDGRGAGQLLVVGFEGAAMSPQLAAMLTRIQPAGVILFARNILNAQQTHKLLKDCQACVSQPLFTMVDLEGGRVDRFRNVTGPAPSAADVFATSDRRLYRKHGQLIGSVCCALGFNTDLAPVLDLAFEASRNVMSSRAFSTNPKEVVLYAREFLAGLHSARVIGGGKHFPGLGEGNLDSHHHLPVIKKSLQGLWESDLVPYRVMKRELALVLINHANYPDITRDKLPASLSQYWIGGVLRKQIGYRGLVVSDDLEMGGVLKTAPIEQAAVEFVRAGGDLCLICHEQAGIERAFAAITREAEGDARFRRRTMDSAKRIAGFKRKHAKLLRIGPAPSEDKIARLSRQLWEFSERIRYSSLSRGIAAGAKR